MKTLMVSWNLYYFFFDDTIMSDTVSCVKIKRGIISLIVTKVEELQAKKF